jgi:hypothetical protein
MGEARPQERKPQRPQGHGKPRHAANASNQGRPDGEQQKRRPRRRRPAQGRARQAA